VFYHLVGREKWQRLEVFFFKAESSVYFSLSIHVRWQRQEIEVGI
jgi:hypothetical protein